MQRLAPERSDPQGLADRARRGQTLQDHHPDADPLYDGHPTPRLHGFRSYISVPIVLSDGRFFGTLCAIDPRPAQLKKPETIEMFRLFASLIAIHLESQLELVAGEKAPRDERESSRLRERFIAVLGHDLRNPLGAIRMGASLLARTITDEEDVEVCRMIDRSVGRMTELIDNVLDLARGRLGGGLSVERKDEAGLAGVLDQVISELELGWPGRSIRREIRIDRPVHCSAPRLGQMLSNLLANALAHGDPAGPAWVRAATSPDDFELSVTNRGPTIPPDVLGQLFQPFFRGSGKDGQQGLGLGLYIATEIAEAHHGTLEVASAAGATCFKFRMPHPAR